MPNTHLAAVPRRQRDFLVVMLGSVIKTERRQDFPSAMGVVERRDRIHSAADQHNHLFLASHRQQVGCEPTPCALSAGCSTRTLKAKPPRAAKRPSTFIRRGWQAC